MQSGGTIVWGVERLFVLLNVQIGGYHHRYLSLFHCSSQSSSHQISYWLSVNRLLHLMEV